MLQLGLLSEPASCLKAPGCNFRRIHTDEASVARTKGSQGMGQVPSGALAGASFAGGFTPESAKQANTQVCLTNGPAVMAYAEAKDGGCEICGDLFHARSACRLYGL